MSAAVAPAALARTLGDGWRRPGAPRERGVGDIEPAYGGVRPPTPRRPGGSAHALADALRALVVDGRLAVRTRVPSERALAPALGVSRGTVSRAYDRLREDGYLVSARGAGSWLALPGGEAALPPPLPGTAPARTRDLTIASLPAPEPLLKEAAARAAQALGRHAASHGYSASGLAELREAVAARFGERGVPTAAEQVFVTAGAQQALHLLLALLCAPGDRVVVDAPAYTRTLAALRGARARAVAVPLTPTGWDTDAWAHSLAGAQPRMAVSVADFHNPTGLTMAPEARAELAVRCARAGVVLVADETNAELRLDGPAPPVPLAGFDPGGAVVTIGSMSKAAWGGLRIGWIRATPGLVRELAAVRTEIDMGSPVLEQLLAVELLARWEDVVASRRALLRPRRDALLAALAEHAPGFTARRPHGGLSAWVRLPAPVATRLAAAAARERLLVTPGPSFSVDGTFEHHLRLPFTAPPEELEAAVITLARLAARVGAAAPAPLEPAGAAI